MSFFKKPSRIAMISALVGSLFVAAAPARAEVETIKVANQYSFGHLTLMIMKDQQFLEKQLKAQGLDQTKVDWVSLAGSSAMIDALLSGGVHVASTGISGFGVLWDRTRGEVKAVGGQVSLPTLLVTRDPNVKSVYDLSEKNRIAVPAVGVSPQAIFLKMAALKEYGKDKVDHFDKLTVTMAHPDAYAAMLSEGSGVDAHFAPAPYPEWELERIPTARVILNSDDLTGGPATTTVLMSTETFRKNNPKSFAAVNAALRESITFINEHPRQAAEILLKTMNNTKDSVDDIEKQIADPSVKFDYVPHNTVKLFNAMSEIGVLKRKPADWKELYFPEAHELGGS